MSDCENNPIHAGGDLEDHNGYDRDMCEQRSEEEKDELSDDFVDDDILFDEKNNPFVDVSTSNILPTFLRSRESNDKRRFQIDIMSEDTNLTDDDFELRDEESSLESDDISDEEAESELDDDDVISIPSDNDECDSENNF